MSKINASRKSNFVFGNDSSEWETTTGTYLQTTATSIKDYGFDHFSAPINPDTSSVHWSLGTDKTDYSTTNFQPAPKITEKTKAKLNKEELYELKRSHFTLGNDAVDYNWKTREIDPERLNTYTKIYHEATPVKKALEAAQKKNITWGYDEPVTESLSKSQYTDPGNNSGEHNQKVIKEDKERTKKFVKELKQSAVCFGYDKPDYSRTNLLKDPRHYNDYKITKPFNLKQNKSSIVFGYAQTDYSTISSGVKC